MNIAKTRSRTKSAPRARLRQPLARRPPKACARGRRFKAEPADRAPPPALSPALYRRPPPKTDPRRPSPRKGKPSLQCLDLGPSLASPWETRSRPRRKVPSKTGRQGDLACICRNTRPTNAIKRLIPGIIRRTTSLRAPRPPAQEEAPRLANQISTRENKHRKWRKTWEPYAMR